MSFVRHLFKSQTRTAIGSFWCASYEAIPESLIFDRTHAFSVAAIGGEQLGKTFAWDTGKTTLLGASATMHLNVSMIPQDEFTTDIGRLQRADLFNRSREPDLKTGQRVLEIWDGQNQKSGKNMRLLFANLDNWYYVTYDLLENNISEYLNNLTTLPASKARQWADFVITSNIPTVGTSIVYDISRPEGSSEEWSRETIIETRDTDLIEVPAYQQLLERHCTLL